MPLGVSFPSARVFSMVSSRALGLILNVSLYESTNTGVPPARLTLSPLAKNVNDGTKTASVFFTPYAISGIVKASVPLAQAITCLTPTYSASLFSSSATSAPPMKCLCARIS